MIVTVDLEWVEERMDQIARREAADFALPRLSSKRRIFKMSSLVSTSHGFIICDCVPRILVMIVRSSSLLHYRLHFSRFSKIFLRFDS